MAQVEMGLVKCPSCKVAVDVHIMHLTSLLGPPAVVCHWCGNVVETERIEWWQMAWQAKAWFFAVSLIYLVLAFFFGGLSTNVAAHFLETGEFREDWGIMEPTFLVSGAAWAVVIVLIQVWRIICSVQRGRESEPAPLRRSLLSFQVAGQLKILLLLIGIPAVCWVISWVERTL